jgi:hypothetical protein
MPIHLAESAETFDHKVHKGHKEKEIDWISTRQRWLAFINTFVLFVSFVVKLSSAVTLVG